MDAATTRHLELFELFLEPANQMSLHHLGSLPAKHSHLEVRDQMATFGAAPQICLLALSEKLPANPI
jgi:hypothetical protein